MEPQIVADYRNETGEGPMWHDGESLLYWIDIPNGKIFWYDPATGEHDLHFEGPVLGGFTIQEDGQLLLFLERGGIALLKDGKLDYLVDSLPGEEENRFNDVFTDSGGRVFCGTMPLDSSVPAVQGRRLGSLYRLDTDRSITKILDGTGISNGMGLTPDRKGLYYTDSLDHAITIFDYDHATGEVANRRTFAETGDDALPDGMDRGQRGLRLVGQRRRMGSPQVRAGRQRGALHPLPSQARLERDLRRPRPDRYLRHHDRRQQPRRGWAGRGRALQAEPGNRGRPRSFRSRISV